MTEFYDLVRDIKDQLESYPSVNTVSFGDINHIDLNKTTLFPLAHFDLGDIIFEEGLMGFTLIATAIDLVDVNKERNDEFFDPFYGNNNLHDVLNTQLTTVNRLQLAIKNGQVGSSLMQLESANAERLEDVYENMLAGWRLTLSFSIPNDKTSSSGGTGC